MMFSQRWIFVYLVIALHICTSKSEEFFSRIRKRAAELEDAEAGNANEFFDHFFEKNKHFLYNWKLDPLEVGEIDICSNCILRGLSSIHRANDATIVVQPDGGVLMDVTVGFNDLRGKCSCSKKILFLYARGDAYMSIRKMHLRMVIKVILPMEPNVPIKANLEYFEVERLDNFVLHWDGKGFLGTLVQWIFHFFRGQVERKAQALMPDVIKAFVIQILEALSTKDLGNP